MSSDCLEISRRDERPVSVIITLIITRAFFVSFQAFKEVKKWTGAFFREQQ